jgi:hypothetical protein
MAVWPPLEVSTYENCLADYQRLLRPPRPLEYPPPLDDL